MKNRNTGWSMTVVFSLTFASNVVQAADVAADAGGGRWYNGIYMSLSGGGQQRGRAAENAMVFTSWEAGYSVSGALGYKISPYFRVEAEGSALGNDAHTLSNLPAVPEAPAQGYAILRTVMFD